MSENNKYRKLLDSIADVIEFDGVLGVSHLYEALPRLVRERLAEKRLPEPDATNPDHWRFAANLIPGEWRLRSGDRAIASIFNEEADRLSAEQAAEEERLDEAARIIHQYDECLDAARALDAAGLLRGGGRGE